jgi:hypothetical protein
MSQISKSYENLKGKILSTSNLSTEEEQKSNKSGSTKSSKSVEFILSKVDDRADYPKALISLAIGGFSLFIAILTLPTVIISP